MTKQEEWALLLKQKNRLRLQVESLKTQLSKKESKLIKVNKRIRTMNSIEVNRKIQWLKGIKY